MEPSTSELRQTSLPRDPARLPGLRVIGSQILGLRRQIRQYLLTDTALRVFIAAVVMFWSTLALDYLPVRLAGADESPVVVRTVLLSMTGLIIAWLIFRLLLQPFLRPLPDRQLAVLLERRFPDLAETLITTIELGVQVHSSMQTKSMLEHTALAAERTLTSVRVQDVLDYGTLRRSQWLAAAGLVSVLAFAVGNTPMFRLACSRVYQLSNTPWPRNTYLEAVGFRDQQLKVARGGDLVLQVRADATRPVPPPDVCYIDYRTADGDRGRATMTQTGSVVDGFQYYQYTERPFRGILSDIEVDFVGNDFRLRSHNIITLDTPAFSDPQLEITPPQYTGLAIRTETPRDGLRVPQGSDVIFRAKATRPLQSVKVWQGQQRKEMQFHDFTDSALEHHLGTAHDAQLWEYQLTDTDGLQNAEQYRLSFAVTTDEPPAVSVSMRGIGTGITPMAILPLHGTLTDDYGLAGVQLELATAPTDGSVVPPEGSVPTENRSSTAWDTPLPTQGTWSYQLDLRKPPAALAATTLSPGTTMTLTVRARDNCNLKSEPGSTHVTLGPLNVVSREELLALIEGRELGLRRRFEQILAEMEESHDTLTRIKGDLDSKTSGSPEWNEAQDIRLRRLDSHARRALPELEGMTASYADIWLELQNNRAETPEIEERIAVHLVKPLEEVAQRLFPEYQSSLPPLRTAGIEARPYDRPAAVLRCGETLQRSEAVLLAMRGILANMLQLEDFNELIDLVRQMLLQQQELLKETETLRNDSLRDLLQE